jgi:hypothetical protein
LSPRGWPFVTDRLPRAKLNQLTRALTPEGEFEPLVPTFDWGTSPTVEGEMRDTRSSDYAVEMLGRKHREKANRVPQLRDPAAPRLRPALMTEQRSNHAVRTERYQYIRYADGGEELFDHASDAHEWTNLASDSRHRETLAVHRRWLPEREAPNAPNFVPPSPPTR